MQPRWHVLNHGEHALNNPFGLGVTDGRCGGRVGGSKLLNFARPGSQDGREGGAEVEASVGRLADKVGEVASPFCQLESMLLTFDLRFERRQFAGKVDRPCSLMSARTAFTHMYDDCNATQQRAIMVLLEAKLIL